MHPWKGYTFFTAVGLIFVVSFMWNRQNLLLELAESRSLLDFKDAHINRIQYEKEFFQSEIDKHREELLQLADKHHKELREVHNQIVHLEGKHYSELSELNDKHRTELDELNAVFKTQFFNATTHFRKQLQEQEISLNKEHKQSITELKTQHEQALTKLISQQDASLLQAKIDQEGETQKLQKQIEDAQTQYNQLKSSSLRVACSRTNMGYLSHVQCPMDRQKIQTIKFATFGPLPEGNCPDYKINDENDCIRHVQDFVLDRCKGLSSCTIPVKPEYFDEKYDLKVCGHTPLFLVVSAECEENEPILPNKADLHDLSSIPVSLFTKINDPNEHGEYFTNIEMFPNLVGPVGEQRKDKSLVAMAVGKRATETVNKIVTRLGFDKYSYMFFRYDDANVTITEGNQTLSVYTNPFTQFAWFNKVVWVSVKSQSRFWYYKRFITPEMARHYEYLWFFDDDCDINDLNALDVQNIMHARDISIAQISYNTKLGPKGLHIHTSQREPDPQNPHIGRWTTFTEIGPALVWSSAAYQCGWHSIMLDTSCGFGIDGRWVDYCQITKAAIIDKYSIIHKDLKTATGSSWWACMNEMAVVFSRIPNWGDGYSPPSKADGAKFGFPNE
eukprot:TRINITY_DN5843_c0_g1_i1.p1 TRINITY_DN5843_c0_g1~~TRINITY_DN5843_c0_g1_i1.p1  ORF type:complete len:616 (-),score=92.80 TRINITY_DN5843_c0_g1_i1:132-1979(-)